MSTSAATAMHAMCINIRTEHQPIIWHKIYVLKRYKGVEKLSTLMDFKNPEILASAFNYRELLIKETLLIQEQQPEINDICLD